MSVIGVRERLARHDARPGMVNINIAGVIEHVRGESAGRAHIDLQRKEIARVFLTEKFEVEEALTDVKRFQHAASQRLQVGGDLTESVVIDQVVIQDRFHYTRAVYKGIHKDRPALTVGEPVEGNDLTADKFLEQIIDGRLRLEEGFQFIFIMDLIGCRRAHADIGFYDQRVTRLCNEFLSFFHRFDNSAPRNLDPCIHKYLAHQRLALDPVDLVALYAGNIEIGAQAGFGFQPVFIMRIDAVQFAIAVRKISEGAHELIVIVQAVDAEIFGEGRSQFRAQGIIVLIRKSKDSHTLTLERHREPVIIGRKVRGQENEVHRSLPRSKVDQIYQSFGRIQKWSTTRCQSSF